MKLEHFNKESRRLMNSNYSWFTCCTCDVKQNVLSDSIGTCLTIYRKDVRNARIDYPELKLIAEFHS